MIAERRRPNNFVAASNLADFAGFFRATAELWAQARAEGRDWLTWDEWRAWGKAAVRAKLVRAEHLSGEAGDPPARYVGYPTDASFWHVAIVRTWRRVQEARELSRADDKYTALQFHRDEEAARKREVERLAQRDRDQAADRAAAIAATSRTPGRRHAGAAGEL